MTAMISNTTPSSSDQLSVDPVLLQMITSIQEAFREVSDTLAQSLVPKLKPNAKKSNIASSGTIAIAGIKTPEQLNKACAATPKPQLQESFKTLFNAVKPLCQNTYTAAPSKSEKTGVLTAASDMEWLHSLEQKLEALSSVPKVKGIMMCQRCWEICRVSQMLDLRQFNNN